MTTVLTCFRYGGQTHFVMIEMHPLVAAHAPPGVHEPHFKNPYSKVSVAFTDRWISIKINDLMHSFLKSHHRKVTFSLCRLDAPQKVQLTSWWQIHLEEEKKGRTRLSLRARSHALPAELCVNATHLTLHAFMLQASTPPRISSWEWVYW